MTAFKKLTAYSDVKCEWVSPTYPYDEENAQLQAENAKLRELVRDVVLLAGCEGCDVTKMQLHVQGGDWRTVWERMTELGVPGTEVEI